ncbi:MAG: hypothetical protein ACRECT_02710 [Thermoplasmata archaeon]
MVDLLGGIAAIFTDPTFGIPLVLAVALTAGALRWAQVRSRPAPELRPGSAPEFWRIQIDSRAYVRLREGKYLVAVDGLGRRLGTLLKSKYAVAILEPGQLNSAAANRVLPHPMTLKSIVRHLTRAYSSAFFAEEPGWLVRQSNWWQRRVERRAARDFALVVDDLSRAIPALEGT